MIKLLHTTRAAVPARTNRTTSFNKKRRGACLGSGAIAQSAAFFGSFFAAAQKKNMKRGLKKPKIGNYFSVAKQGLQLLNPIK